MEFGEEEHPTQPARPAPVELAQQTWLANASRAIRGSLRSATNRWRVIAVAAVEGGAARVSGVDPEEAAAREEATDAVADTVADSDSAADAVADTDTDTDAVADSDSDSDSDSDADADSGADAASAAAVAVAPALAPLPAVDASPGSNRASAAHAVEIVGAVAPFVIAEPLSRRDLGPRGTMRMADARHLLANWGPKGTVKLDTRRRTSPADRRAARTMVLPKPARWAPWLAAGVVLALAGALVSVVLAWGM